ncbi:hypothetical protein C4K23_3135 [Pseudomonas chlororaphis]|nr:hypothetical protein C4K23_3135 [Pseudomonas chlororaphis]
MTLTDKAPCSGAALCAGGGYPSSHGFNTSFYPDQPANLLN